MDVIALPFKAVRPDPQYIEKVNVPPYDVVNAEDVARFTKDNPFSFFHVTRADVEMPGYDEHGDEVYARARENFDKLLQDKILLEDEEAHYFVYSQTWKGKTRVGIITSVAVDEYENNTIKKHELTRPDKEEDRTKLLLTLEFNPGPVFMLFKDQPGYEAIVNEVMKEAPTYAFTDENSVENKVWPTHSRHNTALKAYFEKMDAFYIADGHHRAAAAANGRSILKAKNPSHTGKEDYNYFMAVLFPASQLSILSYNRVVIDLGFESEKDFLKQVSKSFEVDVTKKYEPDHKGEIIVFLQSGRYALTPHADSYDTHDAVASLDVSVLQKNLLEPILKIEDIRTSKNIAFVGGIKGPQALEKMVEEGKAQVGFALYPVDINDLIRISDENKIMPPKSTWFEPKLRSGIAVHRI